MFAQVRQSAVEKLRRYPIIGFVVLAYGLSWLAWSPYLLSEQGLGVLPFRMPDIGDDGQLAGILLGGFLGPLLAAYLTTRVVDGAAGLRVWRGRLMRWRAPGRWYLFAILGIPVVLALGTLAIPGAALTLTAPSFVVLAPYPLMLLLQMVTSSLAEEPGWRDFALPRLQQRHGPVLGATVILGLIWACWHLPLFLTDWGTAYQPRAAMFAVFCLVGVGQSLVITWVFNRSGGSLPLAMLVHASNNSFLTLVWPAMFPGLSGADLLWASLVGYAGLGMVLLVATRGRLGYAPRRVGPDRTPWIILAARRPLTYLLAGAFTLTFLLGSVLLDAAFPAGPRAAMVITAPGQTGSFLNDWSVPLFQSLLLACVVAGVVRAILRNRGVRPFQAGGTLARVVAPWRHRNE